MPRAVKEQIFEESKEWYSLWGVDDRSQPDTYDDFERYLDNIERNRWSSLSNAGHAGTIYGAPPGAAVVAPSEEEVCMAMMGSAAASRRQ